jgi:hypothetical protein
MEIWIEMILCQHKSGVDIGGICGIALKRETGRNMKNKCLVNKAVHDSLHIWNTGLGPTTARAKVDQLSCTF